MVTVLASLAVMQWNYGLLLRDSPAPFHWNWVLEIAAGALLSKLGGRQTDWPKFTLFLNGKRWLIRGETARNTDLSGTDPDLRNAFRETQTCILHAHKPLSKERKQHSTYLRSCFRIVYIFELTLHQWLLKAIVHPKMKMSSRAGEFVSSWGLEKCVSASVSQQWMLCSEWVPSEWESKQLIKTSQSTPLQSIRWHLEKTKAETNPALRCF